MAAGRRARFGIVGLGLSALSGCILLVHPDEYGAHCRLAGSDSECGQCIVARCSAEVDTCCRDSSCATTLTDVEGCTVRRDPSCAAAKAAASLPSGASSSMGRCVAQRCAGECEQAGPESVTSCAGIRTSSGTACSCAQSSTPNSFVCSPATFPETICCAPAGWPGPGLECSCLPVRCSPSTDGCSCNRVDFAVDQHTKECSGGSHCCAADDDCRCGSAKCERSQREVASCSMAEVRCPQGQVEQLSCSR